MSIKGNITLADHNAKILSGSNIKLKIEIENMTQMFFKEIYIMLEGKVQVKWEDIMSKNKDGMVVYFMQLFEGQEVCVNTKTIMEGSGILTAGSHVFNVVIKIPHKLPESFEGKSGWINYELVLMINDAIANQKLYKLPIKMERFSHLMPSELMLPVSAVHNKYFCWGLCNSKPITTKLTLSSASYKPGDIVKYYLEIENFTKYFDVNRISVLISRTHQYKATEPKQRIKQDHCTLYCKTHSLPKIHRAKSSINGTIQLSETLTTTSLEPCLIMLTYKFQVLIIMCGFHTDGYIEVPLIICHQNIIDSVGDNISNEIRLQMEDDPPPKYETLDLSEYNSNRTNVFDESIV